MILCNHQLYDVDEEVAMEAVDVLDEACEEEVSFDWLLVTLGYPLPLPVMFDCTDHPATSFTASC